ncbi:MAG: GNAT family N-acetyltransferase [Propionibacteriaceae bacterium]|jgi:GNAT superfamily N-acetyltransferase|nr:GNAT family N-acetyltransferase [Propionibacteriaceae bacterium]
MIPRWHAEPLAQSHELETFSCGHPALDNWLRTFARRANQQNTARTYVWAEGDGTIAAYYSIAPTAIRKEGLPRSATGGASLIPAYLLARLALREDLHGQGLGTFLLLNAVETICAAGRIGSGRLIVVDALDETALAFYQAHGFRQLPGTLRAYIPLKTAEQLLAGN